MVKEKEESDKRLLKIEIVLGICAILPFIASVIVAMLIPMSEWWQVLIILAGLVPFLIATPFAILIEQKAGYYECAKCGHRHTPKYKNVLFSMHIQRTRYMTCPKCNKRSWQKKVITKE